MDYNSYPVQESKKEENFFADGASGKLKVNSVLNGPFAKCRLIPEIGLELCSHYSIR